MKGLAIISVFMTFLISCGQKKENSRFIPLNVEVDDKGEDILMSSLVDTVFIISLDNHELIGSVNEILWAPERILILDANRTKKIFIFKLEGRLINSIESGSGEPGKFVWPYAPTLSLDEKTFFIISDRTKHLIQYDIDGEFLNDFDISHLGQVNDMIATEKGFAFSTKPDSQPTNSIIFTDSKFQVTGGIDASDYYDQLPFLSGGATNSFYPTEEVGHFYFKEVMSNKILEIKDEKVVHVFDIDLPDSYEVDYSKVSRSLPDVLAFARENGLVRLQDNHVNFGKFMILATSIGGSGRLAIFNRESLKVKFISNIKNDLSIIMNLNAIWGNYNNSPGKIVTALEAPMMINLLENVDVSSSSYASIFKNLSIQKDDNPILIVYNLKKDYQWPFD